MLQRVLLPLALTWLLGSGVGLAVTYIYTRKAFDRSLLDDAYAIAANVALQEDTLVFNLSAREVGVALFDQEERVFFSVLRADGSLLAGQGGLRDEFASPSEAPVFEQRHYRGLELRMVTLWRDQPQPYSVVVAATERSRARLVGQFLAATLVPQAALLLLMGGWLRRLIDRELQPLAKLEQALAQRDTHDLTPLHLAPRTRDIALLVASFNALMSRIAEGVRAQREFAGNVAHELRTPLAGIRSLAEYGLGHKDTAVWREQLRRIAASEERASHLVDQLLALALADEAGMLLELRPVAVRPLLQNLLLRLLPRADELGVDLGADFGIDFDAYADADVSTAGGATAAAGGADGSLCVMASAPLLEGILSNLIDNALRYGRPTQADVMPRVTLEARIDGARLCLSVSDNGPGMDAGQRSLAVARWEQGALGQQLGMGAGLGLAIVARYVALLGGQMTMTPAHEDRDSPGLRTSIWLDCVPTQSAGSAAVLSRA
jgi:two-component system sensor histidine kinase TctE